MTFTLKVFFEPLLGKYAWQFYHIFRVHKTNMEHFEHWFCCPPYQVMGDIRIRQHLSIHFPSENFILPCIASYWVSFVLSCVTIDNTFLVFSLFCGSLFSMCYLTHLWITYNLPIALIDAQILIEAVYITSSLYIHMFIGCIY